MSSKTTLRLLVTSGNGPQECKIAAGHVVKRIEQECHARSFTFSCTTTETEQNLALSSALVTVTGSSVDSLATSWVGTVQWVCKSPVRVNHKRQNWYVGVFALSDTETSVATVQDCDLKFETFRAGGPGGQHQNKTDSAVRVVHLPTGMVAVSRSERSQHRNKQVAIKTLNEKLMLVHSRNEAATRSSNAQLHNELQRGHPVRVFTGLKFKEKSP